MSIGIRRIVALLGAAMAWASGGTAGAQVAQPAERYTIHHFDEARALVLDPTRVAVLVEGPGGAGRALGLDAEVSRSLVEAGLDAQRARAWPIPGWWLVPLEATARGAGGVQGAVDLLAPRGGAPIAGAEGQHVAFVSPVFVDDLGGPMYVTPRLLVGFGEGIDDATARRVLAEVGAGAIVERDWAGIAGAYRLAPATRNGTEVLDAANALARRPEVAWAEPDMAFTGRGGLTPNDPGYSNCWGLHNTGQFGGTPDMDMDIPEAWDTTNGDPSIITVVIDTGVDPLHEDINQTGGIDTTSATGSGEPINQWDNHGTPVAGCVSAIINNATGTVGAAPGTRIASARTFISVDSSGSWTSQASWTVDSLAFAESIGARVTNNSNYYGFTSGSIDVKYASTRTAGIVHFASAGNDGQPVSSYPAVLSTVNSIAALDIDGGPASFTNSGPSIAFAAPGVWAYTTDRTGAAGWTTGSYTYASGTSFASPYAAGVAALVLSVRPSLTSADVEEVLRLSSVDLGAPGRDDTYGHGFVNAAGAMAVLAGPPGAFDLELPLDGAPGAPLTVQLDWSSSLLADSFRVMVDDDPGFGSPEVDVVVGGATTFYSVPAGVLAYASTYHWSVVADNGAGQTTSSPASFTFTTAPPPPPGAFALVAPANGATDVPTGPLLEWAPADGADSYRVLVSTSVLLLPAVVDQAVAAPATTLQLPGGALGAGTTHFWRVTAINGAGSTVGQPTLSSFTTAAPPPACAADLDGDGDTDVLDFAIFASNFGRVDLTPGTGGDLDGDGDADVFDFSLLAQDFGCTSP